MLVATLAVTVFAITRIYDFEARQPNLLFDPAISRLLPEDDPGKAYYDHVRQIFGSDETLLIALVADDVFTPEVLDSVLRITERVEQVEAVHHVVSLSTALNIRSQDEDLEIEPFLTRVPETAEELERVRREALGNPIYAGNLVATDSRATAILVYFVDITEREFRRKGIDETIAQIAEEERGAADVYLTGPPHINVATSLMLISDLVRTVPLILLGIATIAALFFRTVRAVLVPIVSVAVALVWTLGGVAMLSGSLNVVTTLVPPLILSIGFAYTVHIISAYYAAVREGQAEVPMEAGLRHIALAVLLTGLTTVIGFLSLMVSPLGAIREFALSSVIGVTSMVIVSLTFTPALLTLMKPPKRLVQADGDGLFEQVADRLAEFNLRNRPAVLWAGVGLAVLSVWGMSRVQITSDMITNFPKTHPVRVDFEAVNSYLSGANPFYVVVETEYSDAFTDPVNLRQLEDLQAWLEAQPEIGSTTSMVEYVKLINRGFNENDPAHLAIPDDQDLVSQLLMFGANDEIKNFVDSRYRTASVLVRSTVMESQRLAALFARIDEKLAELPDHLHARLTGNVVLMTETLDDIARGQVESLATAFVTIYGILVLLFWSFRVGFIALIPNVLPVAAFFGLMGLADIALGTTTSLIACIVLGIAVDDSIHYLARFGEDSRALASEEKGTFAAIRAVIRPVTVTTAAVCLGFAIFTLSDTRSFVDFGVLGAASLALAWLLDLTLTPALCSRMRVVSIYDVLTLDLGPDPQKSIPLFEGLSRTQAHIVALTASIRSAPAGQRIFSDGDAGDEMYVVIEGELVASRDNGRVELARHPRGDLVGEVALLRGKRTADVDAATDVRLLRLTRSSLDRLSRRYPRTALKVARNLNVELANRLARQTDRIR